ncbi:hypothetical protein G7054_g9841 [Neopestalotiopsis clavispora]|nr:hypothetical protein G7054_g9841 [Neopestalotiopsis clavispora]
MKRPHLCLLFVASCYLDPARASLPNIAIIATGGTIAGVATDSTATTGYRDSSLTVQALIDAVPEIYNYSVPWGIQYSNVGSENINSTLLLGLSRLTQELTTNGSSDGVVITHGTDTLEESAMFLDLTYNGTAPVIMVAAMRPSEALGADGPFNLLQAVGLAASKSASGRGVMITLNDRIGSAMYTTKTNTRSLDTFRAYEQGYLGVFLDASPVFYYEPARALNRPFFNISGTVALPKVSILYGYQEMDTALLEAAVASGSEGIVVACTGDGTLPTSWINVAANITSRGIPVVRASRTGQSYVAPAEGVITSGNFNPQKARILLQLVLSKHSGHDINLIQSYFSPI